MLDNEPTGTDTVSTESGASTSTSSTLTSAPTSRDPGTARGTSAATTTRRRGATRPAGPPTHVASEPTAPADTAESGVDPATEAPAAKKATRKRTAKKAVAKATAATPEEPIHAAAPDDASSAEPVKAAKRTRKRSTAPSAEPAQEAAASDLADTSATPPVAPASAMLLFQPPEAPEPAPRRRTSKKAAAEAATDDADGSGDQDTSAETSDGSDETTEEGGPRRRRRGGRGRRGRGRTGSAENDVSPEPGDEPAPEPGEAQTSSDEPTGDPDDEENADGTRRRRRRRRRGGGGEDPAETDDPPNTVVRVREPRKTRSRSGSSGSSSEDDDGVRSIKGSTRLEAKKQRRREGRDAGRKRPSIITEAEFLARRESVHRTMIVRQSGERTQIAVLEDGVLVEHYVARADSSGIAGNVYLGKVQNVLPSMEAAFVDVGKGRNAVLYAGEVNWDAAGLDGQPKRIEQALKSGDSVLVQVTKDPIGHKGARLSSQVSLAGRYLVYVPNGSMTGISRKLPDTERSRLKTILKKVVPEGAGVIVRTAAEGASEEELARDVTRLTAQWEDIDKKAQKMSAPALLYSEPDLTIRVVRDIFNEDFAKLVISGDDAWDMLQAYLGHVAPDLADRLTRWTEDEDVFAANRVDEQLAKGLDRKVWLPSGGYLIIDRTEAMIVVDVNTGKFTGAGGNLEETVTKNNLEAAEEIVRQLRLRDLGGMIVIDFIDMVLESNRELVLRRLTECLGRDRTKHQVAEVTSLGLVQMTRKRVGQGLHEAFTETCECCNGRGFHMRSEPVEARPASSSGSSGSGGSGGSGERKGRGRGRGGEAKTEQPKNGQPKNENPKNENPKNENPKNGDPSDPKPGPGSKPADRGSAMPEADRGSAMPEADRGSAMPEADRGSAMPEANRGSAMPEDVLPEDAPEAPEELVHHENAVGPADSAEPPSVTTSVDDAPQTSPVAVEDPVEPELEAAPSPRARRRRRATG